MDPSELHVPDAARILHNRLPAGHRYRLGLEGALRAAIGGLSGPWEVSVYPVGRAWFYIDVVSPDASRWSVAIPVPEGPQAEEIAEIVRAGCARLVRIEPARADPEAGPLRGRARAAGELSISQPASLERA